VSGQTVRPPVRRPGGGPPWMSAGMPAEKSMDFGPSAGRLIGRLAPERVRVVAVITLAVLSVGLTVLGPRILGWATDLIFSGVVGRQLREGATQAEAVAAARADGQENFGLLARSCGLAS